MKRLVFSLVLAAALPGLLAPLAARAAGESQAAAPSDWHPGNEWPASTAPLPKLGVQWQPETRSRIELVREKDIPDNAFGEIVRQGRDIFMDTQTHAKAYVGQDNALSCGNCHLGGGRKPHSAPLWAARPMYPAFDKKSGKVITLVERIQRCFEYPMNGKAPAADSREMTALVAYSHWLSTGLPTGLELPGRNYPRLKPPAQAYDPARGQAAYVAQCALCHGADGQGLVQEQRQIFPPLWGKRAYNWASDMQRIDIAAGFIYANMPLGKPNSLSEQDAWDLAAYINSQERPQDPRLSGSVAETAEKFHKDEMTYYGKEVGGVVLGQGTAK